MQRLFIIFVISLGWGCSQKEKSAISSLPTLLEKKELPEKKKEQEKKIPERIFGIPVPPQAFSHFTLSNDEAILTKLSLQQVENFYKKNLVDFEVIRQDKRVFVVGLRTFMASAQVSYYTTRSDAAVIVQFKKPQKYLNPPKYKDGKIIMPKKGDKVELLTSDGKLLAPGATWFEPYTPPVGSPLHKPRYQSNWGTPFGKWKQN